MLNQYSNQVYVVSLSTEEFAVSNEGHSITWIDVVENHQKHFYPLRRRLKGWPVEPPNYMGFRYHGHLQSIHHVESYEVTDDDLQDVLNLQSPYPLDGPIYLCTLGDPIPMANEIPTNDPKGVYMRLYPNGRNWCAIDLLLSCNSVAEAVARSRDREIDLQLKLSKKDQT